MMVTTHAAVGVTLASSLVVLAPEFAVVGALAGLAGGVLPDLDLLVGTHRRTLHFPALYWVGALPALAWAALAPSTASVAAACFLLAAAVHSLSDAVGAGEELRPWERTTDRAVYLHPAGRWLRARRWVRYDGAPEDLALTVGFALPGIVLFDGAVRYLCLAGVALAAVYALFRKRVPDLIEGTVR
ncbi:metal-dependent hydrolase [Halomarina ordinaria]|uniref:Metal-dependent hydrolase n=1 Tax=Halomarina ordinaria TaxID=3033939 RepID=A0ABD5U8G8_9EURY|nr:metal-dependent hydrolase [Halomarina sp. PSRA2]